jgi:hypothetical protein
LEYREIRSSFGVITEVKDPSRVYLRPAIYAKGIGKASISSFKYKALK